MFDIYLFKENKKLNSTQRPSIPVGTQQKYSCVFLDSQSVLNPVIVIEDTKGMSAEMTTYNYAYIPNLMRYYFISNCVILDNSRYCYYLQIDVLATYREDIMSSTQYVLRSTNTYNDFIMDTKYPTIPLSDSNRFSMDYVATNVIQGYDAKSGEWSNIDFFNKLYTSGAVIFGVTGQGNVSVDYYVCTITEFKAFINQVVNTTPAGFSWGNLPTGVQAALSNFLQYITFAKWIPFMPLAGNRGSAVTQIYLGNERFDITAWSITAGLHRQPMRFALAIPDHPLLSTHGYYNLSPYREVNFFFLPIGNVPIDTTKIWGLSTLYCQFIVDLASGNTEFILSTENDDNTFLDHILYNTVGNIGIDLSLTEFSMSMEAALASGISAFVSNAIKQMKPTSAGGSAVHTSSSGTTHGGHGGSWGTSVHTSSSGSSHGGLGGNFGSVVTNATRVGASNTLANALGFSKTEPNQLIVDIAKNISDSIGNALQPVGDLAESFSDFIASSFGQVSTSGHTGSFLMYMATKPVVYCWFYRHGNEDYERFGRPYYDSVALTNLRGFCLCKDANIRTFRGSLINTAPMPLTPEKEAINNLLNTGIYIDHVIG